MFFIKYSVLFLNRFIFLFFIFFSDINFSELRFVINVFNVFDVLKIEIKSMLIMYFEEGL